MSRVKIAQPIQDKHTISQKIQFSAAKLIFFLILSIVILLRMQYIFVFTEQAAAALTRQSALLAAGLRDTTDTAQLRACAAETDADGVLLLLPKKDGTLQVTPGLGNGAAYRAEDAEAVLRTGEPAAFTDTRLGFGVRTYVDLQCYQPVLENGTATAVLVCSRSAYCPFFSHTTQHTLSFFVVFLAVCLILLRYHRGINDIVVRPLSKLKQNACDLTRDNEAFDFMEKTGNELEMIFNAFEILRDRQQRLDESLDYAKEIQSRILAQQQDFADTFSDYHCFYRPLALVSGDFYWMEQFERGSVLVMGDCTGHGIPGALMTMMVISILDSIVTEANCHDTKNIVCKLDSQLSSILNGNKRSGETYIKHGLDLIVLFIDRQHKTIKLSAANTSLYVVKPLNTVDVVRGQRLHIGDGKIKDKNQVKSVYLKYSPKCYYFMATDGLFEQIGGKKHIPYGYTRFKTILFENSACGTKAAIDAVLHDFYAYMHGEVQRDDITVIGFRL